MQYVYEYILIIIFCFLPIGQQVHAQCSSYPRILSQAKSQLRQGEYRAAINLLQAAQEACPEMRSEVNKEINRAFRLIEGERNSAREAQKEALEAKEAAEAAEKQAKIEKETADSLRKEAVNLLSGSIAQALAAKSRQVDNPELSGLLALQAYELHLQAAGDPYDDVIYQGLYTALLKNAGDSTGLLLYHKSAVYDIQFTNDGKQLYSTGSDGKLLAWNWNRLQIDKMRPRLLPLSQHPYPYRAIQVGNSRLGESELMIAGKQAPHLLLLDTGDPKKAPQTLQTDLNAIQSIHLLANPDEFILMSKKQGAWKGTLSSDGMNQDDFLSSLRLYAQDQQASLFVAVDMEGAIWIGNPQDMSKERFSDPFTKHIQAIALSPDGSMIAIGYRDGTVYLWKDIAQRDEVISLGGHTARISELVFDPQSQLLATASYDRSIQVWPMEVDNLERRLPLVLSGHSDWLMALAFHPTESILLGASKDGLIKAWPVKMQDLAEQLCESVNRDLTELEIAKYIGTLVDIKPICKTQ